MNAISLYVTTSRLVLQNDGNITNWSDLYRIVPYLRQSLSCFKCDKLLIHPFSPTHCQHHVCKLCKDKKNIKLTCVWCCDKQKYEENIQLRILLQCYKSLCEHITLTPIFQEMRNKTCIINNISNETSTTLIDLIDEGTKFQDDYKNRAAGLSKSAYSILPCVYTNSSTQTLNNIANNSIQNECIIQQSQPPDIKTVSTTNCSSVYSVMYAESGNKITIKRKTETESNLTNNIIQTNFKKPSSTSSSSSKQKTITKRKGCRCGNATLTPGKLTCCGQRCPCYVESKSCVECKCKGCRNPHRPDGFKVRPQISSHNINNQINNIEHSTTTTTATTNRDDKRNCLQLTLLNGNQQNLCNQISLNNSLIFNATELPTTNNINNVQGTEISINL